VQVEIAEFVTRGLLRMTVETFFGRNRHTPSGDIAAALRLEHALRRSRKFPELVGGPDRARHQVAAAIGTASASIGDPFRWWRFIIAASRRPCSMLAGG
jgi:hypothetical protein